MALLDANREREKTPPEARKRRRRQRNLTASVASVLKSALRVGYPVSRAVGNVKNIGLESIEPDE
jgi:hypothetical protein